MVVRIVSERTAAARRNKSDDTKNDGVLGSERFHHVRKDSVFT